MSKQSQDSDSPDSKALRSFGLIVGGIFGIIGIWPAVVHGLGPRLWAVIAGSILILPAVIWPTVLGPVFRLWMKVGHALGWFNTRVILTLGFFLMITPLGLIMRAFGKDPMNRRFDTASESYRVAKSPRPAAHLRKPF